MYAQTTITTTAGNLKQVLVPTAGKKLQIKYLTFNLDTDMYSAVELYLGDLRIYNQIGVRSGTVSGFTLGRNFIMGGVDERIRVKTPVACAINFNITYREV